MTKLLGGVLGAVSFTALCSLVACTVSSTSDVSDGGVTKSDAGDSGSTGDSATTGDSGGDGGGTCTMAVQISDNVACNNCAKTNCCEKVNACGGNAECVALDNCAGACLDADSGSADAGGALQTCIAACETAHPNGKKDWDSVNNCIDTSCSSTCQ